MQQRMNYCIRNNRCEGSLRQWGIDNWCNGQQNTFIDVATVSRIQTLLSEKKISLQSHRGIDLVELCTFIFRKVSKVWNRPIVISPKSNNKLPSLIGLLCDAFDLFEGIPQPAKHCRVVSFWYDSYISLLQLKPVPNSLAKAITKTLSINILHQSCTQYTACLLSKEFSSNVFCS